MHWLSWRRDPHPDHRAASELVPHAIDMLAEASGRRARLVEYTVWADERGGSEDLPQDDETLRRVQLDITSAVAQKVRALAEHRSQLGGVIKDDPKDFVLPAAMLQRCEMSVETFFVSDQGNP